MDWMAHEFRRQQTMLGGEVTPADKQALRDRLRSLGDKLDSLLAPDYGVDPAKPGQAQHSLGQVQVRQASRVGTTPTSAG